MWSSARRTLSSSKSLSGFHSSPGFIHPFRSRDSCSHALGSFPVPAPAAASSPDEPLTSDTSEPALLHARPQLHSRLDSREEGRKGSRPLAEGSCDFWISLFHITWARGRRLLIRFF